MNDLMILAVSSAVIGALVPKSANDGLKKAVAFLAGLALLLALFRPIIRFVPDLAGLPEKLSSLFFADTDTLAKHEEEAAAWVIKYSTENIEAGVEALLSQRYGLPADSVRAEAITASGKDGVVILERLIVRVDAAAGIDGADAVRFIRDTLACPCEFIEDS